MYVCISLLPYMATDHLDEIGNLDLMVLVSEGLTRNLPEWR